jgi:peptidoglycan/LPS O-acetylase OafA/YrhL
VTAGPDTARLSSVDGIRAIAIIWTIAFHVLYFLGYAMNPHEAWAFLMNRRFALIVQAPLAVDMLFVISGFLIGGYVFRALRRGRLSLRTYAIRRAARIFPAYLAVLGLYALVLPYNLTHLWANLLFVNNYVPVAQQAMAWTWTLGVDAHFYVLFPLAILLVRDRRWYLPLLSAALLLALAVRAYVVVRAGITMPWIVSPINDASHFNRAFDVYYDKTHMHIGSIICGLIIAYLYEYAVLREFFTRRTGAAFAWFLVAAGAIVAILVVPSNAPGIETRLGVQLSTVYLIVNDYAFAAAIAYVLLFAVSEAPRSRAIAGVLSSRIWYWPAELGYSAFLLNPLVILGMYLFVLHPSHLTLAKAIGYELLLIPLAYLAAALLYFSIEKPFRSMARRYTAAPAPT